MEIMKSKVILPDFGIRKDKKKLYRKQISNMESEILMQIIGLLIVRLLNLEYGVR